MKLYQVEIYVYSPKKRTRKEVISLAATSRANLLENISIYENKMFDEGVQILRLGRIDVLHEIII